MEKIQKKIREINLFDFTSFFGLDFLKIYWPVVKGVEAVGLPKVSSGIVQPIDLIHFHYEKSNNDLELLMRKDMKNEKEEETTLKKLEVEKFLRKHVENRLRMNIPYLHQWPNALGNIGLNHVHLTVRFPRYSLTNSLGTFRKFFLL